MGTAKSILFTILSIILIMAGVASLVSAVFLFIDWIHSPDSALILTFIIVFLIILFAALNIIAGYKGVRNHNRRTNSEVMIYLPEISIALSFISLVLSFFNGINLFYICLLGLTGLLIPVIFIYAAVKKSYN